MFELFLALAAILTGLDLYVSYSRMTRYGWRVELNPVALQLCQDFGPKKGPIAAIIFLALYNCGVLLLMDKFHTLTLLHLFVGAKLGLAAMQLKSLQLERKVEWVLKLVQEKRKKNV